MSQTLPADAPAALRLVAPLADLAFLDIQSVLLPREMSPLEAWRFLMDRPIPLFALAFRLRDAISARFGVKRLGGFGGALPESVSPGDRLAFFLVEESAPGLMVLTERDRHLDVMTAVTVEGRRLAITSSVVTHNLFGRLYMLPVAPAHRLIVRYLMWRARRA
ncbi:DUF2867 domain-containing protein [Pararhodobacter aggregans]|uniref:DUF2867 domain-containing protein n=1 Tax=Pararhodobacter aggregans TaxID=404875 RepID=A0A2T7ULM4_9RHOB|nr:DUF2867 domain-containing protein [Pararhodobacter aggregans]PTW99866.1 uncharacterized protein DUF2867 [Pararhodobacter aggregans]PVE45567.1 DUF2867 domain-containing protein [Pararhodobacter aggregans]